MQKINPESAALPNLKSFVPDEFRQTWGGYDAHLLLKALSVAGAGRSLSSVLNGPDSALASLERDLRATCGPFAPMADLIEARGARHSPPLLPCPTRN